jgi:hypothetical protein
LSLGLSLRPRPPAARSAGLGWWALPALWALLLTTGCAVQTEALRRMPPAGLPPQVELSRTPFFPQTEYQCGPAALATALGAVGLNVTPEALAEQVFLPARQGSLQVEMLAAVRRHGAVATRVPGTLDAVLRELAAGHTVVVLQNLGLSFAPVWHYAVLVGYDLPDASVLLRSGSTERQSMWLRTFEHTWARSGYWAFVALPPGQWPPTADATAVVQAAVGFERVAAPAAASVVYASALQRFPADLSLAMGLGNTRHAAGDLRGAEAAFAQAAAQHVSAPAWINLALTRRELGDAVGARQAAARAAQAAEREPAWREAAAALSAPPAAQP